MGTFPRLNEIPMFFNGHTPFCAISTEKQLGFYEY